jgi:hypothetical protein
MAIAFQCSECDAALRVADDFAGKKCKCPQCSAVNVVPEADEDGGGEARRAKKLAQRITSVPVRPTKASGDEAAEGGEPEKPRAKKKAKARAKAGGGKVWLLLGCGLLTLGGGGLLSAAVCGGVIWYFYFSGPAIKEEMTYFPNNTQVVMSVRADQIRDSKLYKDLKADLGSIAMEKGSEALEGFIGIPLDNIDRVVVAGPANSGPNNDVVAVVRTNKPVKAADIIATYQKRTPNIDYMETKVAGKTVYEPRPRAGGIPSQNTEGFCVVGSKLVVFGKVDTLKSVLNRGKAPELSDRMNGLLKSADFSKAVTIVAQSDTSKGVGGGFGGLFGPQAGLSGGKNEVDPESAVGTVAVDSDLTMKLTLTFKDSKAAADAKTKIENDLAEMKRNALKDAPDLVTYKVTASGSSVNVEMTMKGSVLSKELRKAFNR